MSGCSPHIIVQEADPTVAPEAVGDHWINILTGQEFRSLGLSTVADWVLVPSVENSIIITFEVVSKNIRAWAVTIAYLGTGDINTMSYTDGTSTIVKTFGYTTGNLTTLTLSGDTPSGIDLVKTFTYASGDIIGWSYN